MGEQIDWTQFSEVEKIKYESNYLRGTLEEGLVDPVTGAISEADTQLSKFHGIYQQHDRDLDKERKFQKLEPYFSFLIRVRLPAGVVSAKQWLTMDRLADSHANGTLKLTTRQAFQLHGVLKHDLKSTLQAMNDTLLTTIAACGDVTRNVMSYANPGESPLHAEVDEWAGRISKSLTPQTTAYHEIWLEKKLLSGGQKDQEPLYGRTYLPRKFKVGLAIPPYNDVDVFSQDVGLIAIEKDNKLTGFNVTVGGGMGSTFGMPEAYPRLGKLIGFVTPDQVIELIEQIVIIQRDNGDRLNRKQARLKYTIDRLGEDWFFRQLSERITFPILKARKFKFVDNGDRLGWVKGHDHRWNLTLYIEGGRVKDIPGQEMKSALRDVASQTGAGFILTGNQNVVITGIQDKNKVNEILKQHGVEPHRLSGIRRNSLACVALNTCGLAFAEAERYLPSFLLKLEPILERNGLIDTDINLRMTGCPNGCARPYLAEIGLIGKSPGHYNLYLGGRADGSRLNTLYRETLSEKQILDELEPIITAYAAHRDEGERFGDFVIRKAYVNETINGKDFKH